MKISKFQIITLATFIVFIIVGVTAFALYRGGDSEDTISPVTIWGTFPANTFEVYVSNINAKLNQPIVVKYVQKRPEAFSQEFIAALARGTGPDGILIPVDMLLPHYDKLALIPFNALSQRTFMDSYVEEANIYLNPSGILALPFTIDPLMMYWNRDIFNAAGVASYPRYWEEFNDLIKKFTSKDQNGNIRKSAIALGDFSNVANAREILGSLILQKGNPITKVSSEGLVQSTLRNGGTDPTPVLKFFTQFVDPSNPNYSWNRGMPSSKSAFLSGMLATYFGFASELGDIQNKNANLNFDVAPFPQFRPGDSNKKAAYGRLTGFSVVRSSPDPNSMFQVMSILTDPANLAELNKTLYLPTVRRDVIAEGSSDPYITIFNEAALIGKTWLDADPAKSGDIFSRMVQSLTSGAKTSFQAVQDAADEYDIVLQEAMR